MPGGPLPGLVDELQWDAAAYRDVSTVQLDFGRRLLAMHEWRGDERVLDLGCGTGALAKQLLDGHPGLRLVAVDVEPGMVDEARKTLQAHPDRAHVQQADAMDLPEFGPFDIVYSNAVLHWVQDHDAAFACVYRVLAPGGRFLAQCGGTGNLAGVHKIATELLQKPPFDHEAKSVTRLWNYQDDEATRRRLKDVGFTQCRTWLEPYPATFEDDSSWRHFLRIVTLRSYLHALPPQLHDEYLDAYMQQARTNGLERRLDFVRLGIDAKKPTQ